MTDWISELERTRARGEPAVLVSIVSTKGSVPRPPGTRMVVAAEAVTGTIGGGHLEHSAIGIARDMLAGTGTPAFDVRRFPLGASLGQCCGGLVNLYFEAIGRDAAWVDVIAALRRGGIDFVIATAPDRAATGWLVVTAGSVTGSFGDAALDARIADTARALLAGGGDARLARVGSADEGAAALVFLDPVRDADFDVVLFGAGHVARALVAVLGSLPCRVTWVDGRESEFPAAIPRNVAIVVTDAPEAEVEAAPDGTYFLVMTHSHPLDQALAEAILRRGRFAYFGLIGSVSKRRQFERRMTEREIPPECFDDMTCPIGVPGIKGKEPSTIAVAVAAQLLQVREARDASRGVGSRPHVVAVPHSVMEKQG